MNTADWVKTIQNGGYYLILFYIVWWVTKFADKQGAAMVTHLKDMALTQRERWEYDKREREAAKKSAIPATRTKA